MHPEEHELLLYLENKLSLDDRGRVQAHVARCGECAHKLAALFRLPQVLDQSAPVEVGKGVLKKALKLVKPGKSPRSFNFKLLTPPFRIALAGAVVVVIALTTYVLVPRDEPAQFRSDKAEELPRLVLFPEDGTTVIEKTPEFRWNMIGGSAAYRFSLLDEAGAVIWVSDRRDTTLQLPAFIVLQPDKTYLWRVETFFADKTLDRSALHAFIYAPQK
jgi:hypothetical protein